MNFSTTSLMLGVIFGSLGMGYWIYGRKEAMAMPMLVGVALMVYPYFVPGVWMTVIVGILLCAVPFVFRI